MTDTQLQLYNTLTKRKEAFVPIEPNTINMYCCGITVYDYCHIGHGRSFVAFDVMVRFLRAVGWKVQYIRNITDIDDKIINRAKEQNLPYTHITQRFIAEMHHDFNTLFISEPDSEPRATGHISHIIEMVKTLLEQSHAYIAANNDIYFKVSTCNDYGKLSGKQLDELLEGVRIDVETAKQDARDFVLWKAVNENDVGWDSPWGKGRPGWHIECSAMTKAALGDHFDIHGGGSDLVFPHHENEIAQSECANNSAFANYWLHTGALRINNEKMSKSLGNFFTIREVLEKYHPEVIRFFLVNSHYRSAISYSEDNLQEAKNGVDRFYYCLQQYPNVSELTIAQLQQSGHYRDFVTAMNDDFNTREAIAVMYNMVRLINREDTIDKTLLIAQLKALAAILGILQTDANSYLQASFESELPETEIENLIAQRLDAKKAKDYAKADSIRQQLFEQGVQIEDSRNGVRWRRI